MSYWYSISDYLIAQESNLRSQSWWRIDCGGICSTGVCYYRLSSAGYYTTSNNSSVVHEVNVRRERVYADTLPSTLCSRFAGSNSSLSHCVDAGVGAAPKAWIAPAFIECTGR